MQNTGKMVFRLCDHYTVMYIEQINRTVTPSCSGLQYTVMYMEQINRTVTPSCSGLQYTVMYIEQINRTVTPSCSSLQTTGMHHPAHHTYRKAMIKCMQPMMITMTTVHILTHSQLPGHL